MKVVQRQQDVRGVEASGILLEATNLGQIEEQLAARAVLENEEQFAVTLKRIVHFDDEGMPDVFEDASLSHRVLYLIPLYDFCLLEYFERIQLASVLLLHEHDLAEGAFADHRDHLKVFLRNVAAGSLLLITDALLVLSLDLLFLLSNFLRCEPATKQFQLISKCKLSISHLLFGLSSNIHLHICILVRIHVLIGHAAVKLRLH